MGGFGKAGGGMVVVRRSSDPMRDGWWNAVNKENDMIGMNS